MMLTALAIRTPLLIAACAILGAIIAAVAVALIVILIRALAFKPKAQPPVDETPVEFDKQRATEALRTLVRCKTVSYRDPALEDDAEFEKLIAALPTLYPNVFATCTMQRMPDRGLLFHWKGKTDGNPAVLMAHYDVVPVNEDLWDVPAFEALLKDGCVWGRGTLDAVRLTPR